MTSGRRVVGAIRSFVNARDFQLEYARVLHEMFLVHVLMYGSETMLWMEGEEGSRIRAAQMDNHRGLLGPRRMDGVPQCMDKGVLQIEERPRISR